MNSTIHTNRILFYSLFVATILVSACNSNNHKADAYGNFQATEIFITSEVPGRIVNVLFDEGEKGTTGQLAVEIDSVQYMLKVDELESKKQAALAKKANVLAQVSVYEKQKTLLEKDVERISNMLKDGAATQKQFDDLTGQIDILDRQINLVKTNLASIQAEVKAFEAGIAQAKDMLRRTKIYLPSNGTIIEKYAETGEVTGAGKAILKLAKLEEMELKAYVSEQQLSALKTGQELTVSIDNLEGDLTHYRGFISWISSEAEFTPKNIQTKEERLSQVYAIKVKVKNDGLIKINMPGEIRFNQVTDSK
ncbi:MAG: HlyD family efflux transporter periplasmic adaptor subunit [Bacteroidales bacterium]|nr:HlyD family efflux transporter periplasmic adaptor subunit [Bacteroidales bacterium]MBN2818283.1 HlyD family efflux transporter periplasmic adaptor subunit [Bacteroidales bacterium]